MNKEQRWRARLVFIGIAFAGCVLIFTLYGTQITGGFSYAAKANRQYSKPAASVFDRGSIFFKALDGTRVSAATVTSGHLIYANPTLILDKSGAYDALSQFIKIDRDEFTKKVSKPHDSYEELAHRVDDKIAQSVSALALPGIGITVESWRLYPGDSLAAQTLGLIGENSDTRSVEGRYGLEKQYESVLARPGISSGANIFAQIFLGLRNSVFGGGNRGDIISSIEPTIQGYLEKVLADTSALWHPNEIGGIIIDPQNGGIIAAASLPTFNPNDTSNIKDARIFSNPLVESVYEMGSIMKPLTIATGLDSGAITASSTYDDTGTIILNGKKISNYDGKARGIVDIQQILSQSLNVGAATVALKTGAATFSKYMLSFGLGNKTGVDLPNEATGIVKNYKTGRDIEIATASYGQGIAVSPIAMADALSILANGGYVVRPHAAAEIDYVGGSKMQIAGVKTGPILKKQSVDDVTRMLVKVVDEVISKKHPGIYFPHYSVAAKTGTAQVADHANGGYYKNIYLHSFFGYFPAYNARFLVFLYQLHPKGAQYASDTLTDPFIDLTKFLINYYNVLPDR